MMPNQSVFFKPEDEDILTKQFVTMKQEFGLENVIVHMPKSWINEQTQPLKFRSVFDTEKSIVLQAMVDYQECLRYEMPLNMPSERIE